MAFLQWALPRMEMRWRGFRRVRGQVCKRLSRRLGDLGVEGLDDYRRYLDEHPGEWDVLDAMCRITVSRFYRDRAVFETLRERVLPELARSALDRGHPVIRCWSAGCASGEEPYGLALAWELDVSQRFRGVKLSIVATDADSDLLERARVGCYPSGTLRDLPREWIARAFDAVDDELCLRPELRKRLELARQDIRREMPPGPLDLVLCRNLVFTYFEPALQGPLLSRMLERIAPGGFLVLGGHEELPPGEWPLDRFEDALPIHRRPEWA